MQAPREVELRPPARLLHVLSGLEVGGKERVVLDLARRARAAGLDHRLCLFDTPFRDAERDFDPGEVPHVFLARGPGLDLAFARRLARHVRAEGFEVLHAHNDTALVYAALAGLRLGRTRPRTVATFHTRPGHATRGARWLTRLASGRLAGITAVSEDLGRHLTDTGWLGRCAILWNGIDLERWTPAGPSGPWRAELGLGPEVPLVVHLARHDPVKRQEDLIEAARILAAEPGTPCVLLVGEGPRTEALRAAARGLAHVRFRARVQDVPELLRAADALVLCSGQEAAPRVLLEALACGCPVVATDVGGCRHLLTGADGAPCGVLVPPADPRALAGALRELLRMPERRAELARRGRLRAADFSAEAEWRGYVRLWSGAIHEGPSRTDRA